MASIYYSRNFTSGYYYHIYNRGAFKKNVFLDNQDYDTFTNIFSYYLQYPSNKPYSEFELINSQEVPYLPKRTFDLCEYCLMPNHFHFLVKQISEPQKETNITNFMKRITIAYSMHHKKKYNRTGALFESKYKNIIVDNDSQLLHLSRYIHLNPNILDRGTVPLEHYPYSSYRFYLDSVPTPEWIHKEHIMKMFSFDPKRYKSFIMEKSYDYGLTEKTRIE